ncbi:MAG: hypothetical protein Fur0037_26560 [Planctomycetota bacterium]
MTVRSALWLACALGACAAAPPLAAPARRPSLVAHLADVPEPVEAMDDRLVERAAREALAAAADPSGPALDLVDWLAARERLAEGLPVLDAALARKPGDPVLLRRRADLLRDLGRRKEALAILAASFRDADDPEILLDTAEMAWLEGDRDGARQALDRLLRRHGASPYVERHAGRLAVLDDELRREPAPRRILIRDLLANLRGATRPGDRAAALEILASAGGEAASRACAIALADQSALVRASGMRLAVLEEAAMAKLVEAALADPSALVRAAAATRALELGVERAVPLLIAAIAAEEDSKTFATMHQILKRLCPDGPEARIGAEEDPAERAALAAAWRSAWHRSS